MTPRVLVLSVLDPLGQRGLAAAVKTVQELGAQAIPLATGVVSQNASGQLQVRKQGAKFFHAAVNEALEEPLDGMLVELLPSYWQTRALARALRRALPETLVYAPFSAGLDRPWMGPRNTSLQKASLLREATTVVLPADDGGAMMLGSADAAPADTAAAVLAAGAHSAWMVGRGIEGRRVDLVAHNGDSGVLDYPSASDKSSGTVAAALVALLASGLPLRESINQAHRHARDCGNAAYVAASR